MAGPSLTRRLLIVEACDLDSDARDRQEFEVDAPRDPAAQREQLAEVVGQIHPTATLRSFANGAATFLGPGHLIVAHYGAELPGEVVSLPAASQRSLFAA
jgi:hypothetical protein